jgi:hypothetical protein
VNDSKKYSKTNEAVCGNKFLTFLINVNEVSINFHQLQGEFSPRFRKFENHCTRFFVVAMGSNYVYENGPPPCPLSFPQMTYKRMYSSGEMILTG